MDSSKPTQGDKDERGTENVVRLPRDWLGPREELVPIGARAHAVDASDGDPTEAILPTAASFWGEDSGSLQAPMQAPEGAWQPTPAGQRVRARPRRRRPQFEWSRGGPFTSRRRAAASIGGLAACALLILAVIGRTEGGTRNAGDKTASVSRNALIATGRGANRALLKAKTPVVTQIQAQPQSHRADLARNHAGRSRAPKHRIHVTTSRRRHHSHPKPRPTNSTSKPVRTTTPAPTTPVSSPTTTPTPTTSAPSASSDRSTSSSSQHQPAFGASGSLGPGSSPDS